jgi:hypothetical protein
MPFDFDCDSSNEDRGAVDYSHSSVDDKQKKPFLFDIVHSITGSSCYSVLQVGKTKRKLFH